MNCNDFAEYVSALCDGQTIPPAAAEHIGKCSFCQAQLRDYVSMGAELRRIASTEFSGSVPTLVWTKKKNDLITLWEKGMATMRIPRLAFIVLIGGFIALASSLAIVKVRAHADGIVVLLTVDAGLEKPIECALSTVDRNWQGCGFIGDVGGKVLGYKLRLIARDNGAIDLGFKAREWPMTVGGSVSYGLDDVDREPERQYRFEPGETLKIDEAGLPPLVVKGSWLDHMPSFVGANQMDPGPDELRIISPLLLQGKQVIGDLAGGSATQTKPDWAVLIYFPGHGSYLIANSRLQGAVEAKVNLNRISFEENGSQYEFLTGAPITRAQKIWILHQSDFTPSKFGQSGDNPFISGEALRQTDSGTWMPAMQ